MVVLLPTFGFTTADAIFKFVFVPNTNETYRWECVFLPDSGAFFVNYIITAALVGAGLELIRFPELFFYLVRVSSSKRTRWPGQKSAFGALSNRTYHLATSVTSPKATIMNPPAMIGVNEGPYWVRST